MSEDKRLDEVIRVRKRPNNFVMLDKTFLEDDRLSFKAKGILAYLLSKPDNWKVIVGNLVKYSKDGKSAVYAGLKELKECGYYVKTPIRSEDGRRISRWESTVYEMPDSLLSDFQEIDNEEIENQYLENRERNNNYYNNKLNINNNHVSLSVREEDKTDETDEKNSVENTLEVIHDNIGYEQLRQTNPEDMGLIDEFVNVMLDTLLSKNGVVRINGEEKPRALVQSQIMKVGYDDILLVLMQFRQHKERIQKKRQYILSMLYHAPMERNAHYTNLVHAEFGY
jgi:phage replication protein